MHAVLDDRTRQKYLRTESPCLAVKLTELLLTHELQHQLMDHSHNINYTTRLYIQYNHLHISHIFK